MMVLSRELPVGTEENHATPVRTSVVQAEIRTEHLQNPSLDRYNYINRFRYYYYYLFIYYTSAHVFIKWTNIITVWTCHVDLLHTY
jgi:hypothetical protein